MKKNELFLKKIKMIQKHQTDILELEKSMNEMKNGVESLCMRADKMKEQICA